MTVKTVDVTSQPETQFVVNHILFLTKDIFIYVNVKLNYDNLLDYTFVFFPIKITNQLIFLNVKYI